MTETVILGNKDYVHNMTETVILGNKDYVHRHCNSNSISIAQLK